MYVTNTLLVEGRTNGNPNQPKAGGNDVTLYLNSAGVANSRNKPDRILIALNGGPLREIGYLDILPDGSMTVEGALLLWGRNHNPKLALGVLRSIASIRTENIAEFSKGLT